MTAPRIGVLALQGDVREHARALTEAGADPVSVRRPADLVQVDGLVLPGGESTTIGTLLELFELLEPLRAAVRSELDSHPLVERHSSESADGATRVTLASRSAP